MKVKGTSFDFSALSFLTMLGALKREGFTYESLPFVSIVSTATSKLLFFFLKSVFQIIICNSYSLDTDSKQPSKLEKESSNKGACNYLR